MVNWRTWLRKCCGVHQEFSNRNWFTAELLLESPALVRLKQPDVRHRDRTPTQAGKAESKT
jgi:hypothetical protein